MSTRDCDVGAPLVGARAGTRPALGYGANDALTKYTAVQARYGICAIHYS